VHEQALFGRLFFSQNRILLHISP